MDTLSVPGSKSENSPGDYAAGGLAPSGQGIIPTPAEHQNEKARCGECRPGGKRSEILLNAVRAHTPAGFKGLDGVAGFFHRTGHEPAHGVFLPSHSLRNLR